MKNKLCKKNYLFFSILIFCLLTTSLYGQNLQRNCSDIVEYQIREGDTMSSIAKDFGSQDFKEFIIDANSDLNLEDTALIPGQIIRVPTKIYHFKDSGMSLQEVLSDPLCDSSDSNRKIKTDFGKLSDLQEADTSETGKLEEFRKAFQSLVEQERDSVQEKEQAKAEQQLFLELDGLVIDDTRSKIGRDFYDIFYQKWDAPEDSHNYTITISEKPTPTLGSLISVDVNDYQAFQYRLQPRYEIIEEAAEYAVRITYIYMKDNRHQYTIY